MLTPFDQAVQDIIAAGKWLDARGLAPATSGNYSVRLPDNKIAVTVSGKHKGKLGKNDVMMADSQAKPLEDKKPSDEARLHAHIYKNFPEAKAILHCHSIPGAILTRAWPGKDIVLSGYEMLKIFPGITTHDVTVTIPVVDNSQVMSEIIAALDKKDIKVPAYMIRDHGFYVWGPNMFAAENLAEALEHLLAVEAGVLKIKEKGA